MTWMNAEAYGTSGLATWILFALVGRARPSFRECEARTTDDPLCRSGISAGFPSGHTASAFTAAGLACAHHSNVPLYGGGVPDLMACFGALAVATGAGTMRLVGDRHYATDGLAGAAIGLAAGYAMPTFLHYRARARPAEEGGRPRVRVGWSLGADGAPLGATTFGWF
jgi:membrane-associated phospholipid phosphatase